MIVDRSGREVSVAWSGGKKLAFPKAKIDQEEKKFLSSDSVSFASRAFRETVKRQLEELKLRG